MAKRVRSSTIKAHQSTVENRDSQLSAAALARSFRRIANRQLPIAGERSEPSYIGSSRRERLAKRLNSAAKASLMVPRAPDRCLAISTSAIPTFSGLLVS